jgi:hypothetical protein
MNHAFLHGTAAMPKKIKDYAKRAHLNTENTHRKYIKLDNLYIKVILTELSLAIPPFW